MKKRTGTILLLIVAVAAIGLAIWLFAVPRRSPADRFLTAFYTLDGADKALGGLVEAPLTEENSAALIAALYGPLADDASEKFLAAAISQRLRLDLAQWAVRGGYTLTPGRPVFDDPKAPAGQPLSFSLDVSVADGSGRAASIQQTGELQTDGDGYVTYFRPDDLGRLLTWTR